MGHSFTLSDQDSRLNICITIRDYQTMHGQVCRSKSVLTEVITSVDDVSCYLEGQQQIARISFSIYSLHKSKHKVWTQTLQLCRIRKAIDKITNGCESHQSKHERARQSSMDQYYSKIHEQQPEKTLTWSNYLLSPAQNPSMPTRPLAIFIVNILNPSIECCIKRNS